MEFEKRNKELEDALTFIQESFHITDSMIQDYLLTAPGEKVTSPAARASAIVGLVKTKYIPIVVETEKEKLVYRLNHQIGEGHVYRILFDDENLSDDALESAAYIESPYCKEYMETILAGLQFYIEGNTEYGETSFINESIAAYFLSIYFKCTLSDEDAWKKQLTELKNKQLDPDDYQLPLYQIREKHCGPHADDYAKAVVGDSADDEFFKALRMYYDTDECIKHEVPPITFPEILKMYQEAH